MLIRKVEGSRISGLEARESRGGGQRYGTVRPSACDVMGQPSEYDGRSASAKVNKGGGRHLEDLDKLELASTLELESLGQRCKADGVPASRGGEERGRKAISLTLSSASEPSKLKTAYLFFMDFPSSFAAGSTMA